MFDRYNGIYTPENSEIVFEQRWLQDDHSESSFPFLRWHFLQAVLESVRIYWKKNEPPEVELRTKNPSDRLSRSDRLFQAIKFQGAM